VALTAEGKVLLVREYRHARRSLMLGLPGGSVASPSETPRRAAERELMEETGYTASRFIELGKSAVNAATHSNLHWSFLALGARRAGEPSLDANEELELEALGFAALARNLGRAGDGQALHLETLLLAIRFILADRSEKLAATRHALLIALTAPADGDEGA
jgi:ADP-ribose pyrophosphatase